MEIFRKIVEVACIFVTVHRRISRACILYDVGNIIQKQYFEETRTTAFYMEIIIRRSRQNHSPFRTIFLYSDGVISVARLNVRIKVDSDEYPTAKHTSIIGIPSAISDFAFATRRSWT